MTSASPDRRWDLAFGISVAVLSLGLLVAGRDAWFMYDDWQWLGVRRELLDSSGLADFLLWPHNDHLMAGVLAWHLSITSAFGVDSYLPSLVTITLANAGVVVVLRAAMMRVGVGRGLASGVAPLILVFAAGSGCLWWGPETSFSVTAGLVIFQLLLLDHEGPGDRRDVAAMLVSTVAVACHSIGVIGAGVAVAMLLLRRRWTAAAMSSVPLALYGAWAVTWGRRATLHPWWGDVDPGDPSPGFVPSASLRTQAETAVELWAHPLLVGALSVTAGVAAIVLVAVVLWRFRPVSPLLLALTATATAFAAAVARSRAVDGLRVTGFSRYAFVMALLVIPVLALAAQQVADLVRARLGTRAASTMLVAVVTAVGAHNVSRLDDQRAGLLQMMTGAEHAVRAVSDDPHLELLDPERLVGVGIFHPTADLRVRHVQRLVDLGHLTSRAGGGESDPARRPQDGDPPGADPS